MYNRGDVSYSGFLYIGSPISMPARVVFDTGSSFLAVTSNFCEDSKNDEFYFVTENKYGDIVELVDETVRCKTTAYNTEWTKTGLEQSDSASKIFYGSAQF